MASKKGDLYQKLFNAYKKCNPEKKPALSQDCVIELWKKFKTDHKNENDFEVAVKTKTDQLLQDTQRKSLKLMNFFTKKPSCTPKSGCNQPINHQPSTSGYNDSNASIQDETIQLNSQTESKINISNEGSLEDNDIRSKPAQEACEKNISVINSKLNSMLLQRDSGLSKPGIDKKISDLRRELDEEKKLLKRKQQSACRSAKARAVKKAKIEEVCSENPDIAKKFKLREAPERPRLEDDQPELLKHIVNIAMLGSSADERRRSESIRNCKTLDQLHIELKRLGMNLSRSATYLRLLPRNSTTLERKRHVKTVPVKLIRAQNDTRKKHTDTEFATTSIRYLETLASFLGPNEVFFFSQDDKARVPLGITAATKQAPLLMHLEYRVRLPDHDWVVAPRHKLIPSVYAAIVIKPNGFGKTENVTYSGPTYIAIRSGKHSSSNAQTHFEDLEKIFNGIESFVKTSTGAIKPVVILSVDGGPDENLRYQNVIRHAIEHFRRNDLDALFIVTNAPGRSSYNRVERRMAPLSHELAGLILPHEQYGSHLNEQGQTIDITLEKRNFAYAGETLAQVWRGLTIDGHPVEAEYIDPKEPQHHNQDLGVDKKWYSIHVRESQYLLPIVKCSSQECCGSTRSSLRTVLPNGFLPPPIRVQQKDGVGLCIASPIDQNGEFLNLLGRLSCQLQPNAVGFKQIPYDLFCPTVYGRLTSRVCVQCGLYHATDKRAIKHTSMHQTKAQNADGEGRQIYPIVRPVRVAARRARELLCIFLHEATGEEDAEWVDETDIDQDTAQSFESTSAMETPSIITVEEAVTNNPFVCD